MMSNPAEFETTLLDFITTANGRTSKKLFNKIIIPKIEKLEQLQKENERLIKIIHTALSVEPDPEDLDLYGISVEMKAILKLALNKETLNED